MQSFDSLPTPLITGAQSEMVDPNIHRIYIWRGHPIQKLVLQDSYGLSAGGYTQPTSFIGVCSRMYKSLSATFCNMWSINSSICFTPYASINQYLCRRCPWDEYIS